MAPQSVILITGCSSGIGAALAGEFHERGHRVFATARRPESLAALAARGIRTLALDVTNADSIAAAATALAQETGFSAQSWTSPWTSCAASLIPMSSRRYK